MKTGIKIVLCMALAVFALMSLASVLGSIGALPASAEGGAYLLREYEGYVAVYHPAEAETPSTVTDIRIDDLPESDRTELAGGILAPDHDTAVRLLEDYGA